MDNPLTLTVALAGIGVFSGVYHPIGMGLVSKNVERISVAMGYNAVFGGLGLVLGPLGTGIVNWISGPRAAYVFLAFFNLAGLILMALLPLPEAPPRERRAATGGASALPAFMILMLANMLAGIAYSGATVILTPYLELKSGGIFQSVSTALGINLSGNLLAAVLSSAVYVLGMTGQYIGGFVGERHDTRYTYLFFHIACVPAAFLMGVAHDQPLVGLAMFYMFFMLGMQPAENTLVAQLSPQSLHHSAFGLKFIATFGMGSLGVKLVQWVETAWGVDAVFPSLGAVSVVLVLSIFLLIWQTNRRPVT
jgi:MFS family permease